MAQFYLDPMIKTLQILGKEDGTQEVQPSCLVIFFTASVTEASRITPGVNSGVIRSAQTELMYAKILGLHQKLVYTKLRLAYWS